MVEPCLVVMHLIIVAQTKNSGSHFRLLEYSQLIVNASESFAAHR